MSYKAFLPSAFEWRETRILRQDEEVTTALRGLMDRLGPVYGAIDMRLGPDGRYVFFEVNPAGQWLFVEERTGQPITATRARLLAAHADGQPAADEGMLSDSSLADRAPQAAHVEG